MRDTGGKLKAVLNTVQNQLTAGALMAVGFAVERYKELITPTYPLSSFLAGLIVVLIGFGLSVWALFDSLRAFQRVFSGSKWQLYIACGLAFYLWGFMVTALFFVGAKDAA